MRLTSSFPSYVLIGSLAVVGAGCSVEQTEQAEAPDVDVDVDPGQWPEYDIDWADVDVGTREQTVSVPVVDIRTERREVTVPYLDINPPGASGREERAIVIGVDVPHAGYRLAITEVRAANDDLWVIGRLEETDDTAAQVNTRVSDRVVVNAPDDLDVRKVIVGARPEGAEVSEHRFVSSMSALNIPSRARVLYQRGGDMDSPGTGSIDPR